MKLRKLARQLAAAAVAGAMALSLCMPALAETWNISNKPEGFKEVYSINVVGTTNGRTVELSGVDASDEGVSASYTETEETAFSGSGAARISLGGGVRCAGERGAGRAEHQVGGPCPQRRLHRHRR